MRQFLYLVVANYDEETYPRKIFFQEREAMQWGKTEAKKVHEEYPQMEFALYKQEIARKGILKWVRSIIPDEEKISALKALKKQIENGSLTDKE